MIDKTDPTNRDTVPAMLTPGEFVLNKEATQMYGPVIQQMNNAGLQQRAAENKAVEANMGGGIPPKGYNTGAQVQGLKGFLDFIGSGEGGYEASNRGTNSENKIVGSTNNTMYKGKKLSEMTVDEILKAQSLTGDDRLFAVGKYQMIPSTFKEVVEGMGLSGDTVFSPEFQDQAGMYLATQKRPILGAYLSGKDWKGEAVDEDTALMELAKEWASAPLPYDIKIGDTLRLAGDSRYGNGNKAQHSIQEARDAIRSAKISMTGEYPTDPQNYGEYSPSMFLAEAQTLNTPGASTGNFMDATNQVQPETRGVPIEEIQTTFLPDIKGVPTLTEQPPKPQQSFGEAFAAGRAAAGGSGGVFDYQGNQYSTNLAEEEDMMARRNNVMTANMGGQINKSVPMMYANHGTLIPSGLRTDDDLHLPEVNSDEALLQGSSQSADNARFEKQNQMQNLMRYQQQQRGIENNQIPMTYDLETRQLGDPSYRQQASDNELFGGPLNFVNDGPTLEDERKRDEAELDALVNAPPAMNVPINPPRIEDNPTRDDGLVVNPEPTFGGDVVPFVKRLTRYDKIMDAASRFDKNLSGVLPVGSVDVNKEYRDLMSLYNSGTLDEAGMKATEIRMKTLEKNRAFDQRMDTLGLPNLMRNLTNVDNKIFNSVGNYVYPTIGNMVSSYDPTKGANITRKAPGIFVPQLDAPPSPYEVEFDAITNSKGFGPPEINDAGEAGRGSSYEQYGTQIEERVKALKEAAKKDPPPPPPNTKVIEEQGNNSDNEAKQEAVGLLSGVFGDLFSKKELARAAIMYLGGRATGMSGNQALAFAGKTYLGREEAREDRHNTLVAKLTADGDNSAASIRLFAKTRNLTHLEPIPVGEISKGNTKTYYGLSNGGIPVQAMDFQQGTGGSIVWRDSDGRQLDLTKYHTDSSRSYYAQTDSEKATAIGKLEGVVEEIRNTFDISETATKGKLATYKTDLLPKMTASKLYEWGRSSGVDYEALPGLYKAAFDKVLVDTNNKVRVGDIEGYLNEQWVTVKAGDPSDFMYNNGKKDVLVETSKVNEWTQNMNDMVSTVAPDLTSGGLIEFSQFLRESDLTDSWRQTEENGGISDELRQRYITRGALKGNRVSGYMLYMLEQTQKDYLALKEAGKTS